MAKIKSTTAVPIADSKIHKGYNEKNPTQPEGAFVAASQDIVGKAAAIAPEPIGKEKGIDKKELDKIK